ncbi:MAG: hypothetical protein EBT75_00980 [Proteobacteria bacterium]|nr:hypothetical protein [Pseudomonadota bacterium]NBS06502.1 hypothetical protein [Verrucomicrobiota bacterium]NBS49352.1 hypothetical protein [Verrucomicrobiota bacterium]NBS78863.1 hypothetical protein [bacterium]
MKLQRPDGKWWKPWERSVRGWLYRRLPAGNYPWHLKRRGGYERRWGLETRGFTKRGFFGIFRERLLPAKHPGHWIELQAGDGLVGSLGLWLEEEAGHTVEAWEHRKWPTLSFQKNRPKSLLRAGRLTSWEDVRVPQNPVGVTTRGIREAAGVCRAIREAKIRPLILGIWNPGRNALWESRLRPCGYRLELVYERMEFYRCRNP